MKLSPSAGGGLPDQPASPEEEQKCLNSELWHACAGPLVSLPAVGSRVVYFPQGHSEQVAASTNKEMESQIPNYPNLPPQLICQLHNVTMHADAETDEVYAQMTLQPLSPQELKDPFLPAELGTASKQPTNYFCKTLTASDTSTHGGFSVPRRAAEKVFPPLDFTQQPPAQELIAKDLHGNEWKFRHIFRGQPKRHLLTTGWSIFVNAKRLVAGDSVLFIWNDNNQLLLGIRRANRPQTVMPSSVLSSDSMHIGLLAAAAHAASTNSRFTIFYNPRASPSEFVISLAKYVKTVYHTRISVGMRFRMLFETEESSVRRYMGTITGISDLDPVRWPNSHWRSVKVGWDESTAGERQPRVSLWEIEPLTTFPMYPSPFPLRLKRPWPTGLPSLYGGKEDDLTSSLMWLRDGASPGFQSLNFSGLGMSPWMQPRLDSSLLGLQPDMYQTIAAAALQNTPKQVSPAVLQFQQPQNIVGRSALLSSQILQQVQPQFQQMYHQNINENTIQGHTLPEYLQQQFQRCQSFNEQKPQLQPQQQQQESHHHQQSQCVQRPQHQYMQQQKHLPNFQSVPNALSAFSQLSSATESSPSALQTVSAFSQQQNFPDTNISSLSPSNVSSMHNTLRPFPSEAASNLPAAPRTTPVRPSLRPLRHPPLPLSPTSNYPPPPPPARLLLPPLTLRRRSLVSAAAYMSAPAAASPTLLEYMGQAGTADDLAALVAHIQGACKRIAALVASPGNAELSRTKAGGGAVAAGRDAPKPLDELSNEIILSSLQSSGKVAMMASEENDLPIWISNDGPYVVVTDPLDGSRNIEVSIPTGTIFGIYNRLVELDHLPVEERAQLNSLQSGTRLVAAGYVLYSSATIFCISFGAGTHGFTLDRSTGEFILTHPSIQIPPRGQIYSVNDARYFDWPKGLRQYIDTIRQGKGQHPKKYSARYVCSLVADFHRTLIYGGVAMNPRDHLRLVYEANPLSFLAEQAGGRGSDGKVRILSIQPVKLHQRLPLFLGSMEDMLELESYGDVQQKVNPGYEV